MTSRRGFIGTIGALLGAATLDPERLLWVPGRIVYSIPAPPPPSMVLLHTMSFGWVRVSQAELISTTGLLMAGYPVYIEDGIRRKIALLNRPLTWWEK